MIESNNNHQNNEKQIEILLTENSIKTKETKMTLLEQERQKEKRKLEEKEKLFFLDFHNKSNLKHKKKFKLGFNNNYVITDLESCDMITNYVDNPDYNKIKKDTSNYKSLENLKEDKVHRNLYKIPKDLLEFLKRK